MITMQTAIAMSTADSIPKMKRVKGGARMAGSKAIVKQIAKAAAWSEIDIRSSLIITSTYGCFHGRLVISTNRDIL
jgi:hypothetical protein